MRIFSSLVLCALTGCAHYYYYLPEIDGEGEIHGKKGGAVYTIPAKGEPELTMHVRSLGIHKVHNIQMLGMRLSFVHPKNSMDHAAKIREFLDANDQTIRFGDEAPIKPAYVHSKFRNQTVIELGGSPQEVVELLYPLAKDNAGPAKVETFYFHWKIHFGGTKVEEQLARFDRYDKAPQQSANMYYEDSEYPYDIIPMDMPGWRVVRDPFWWSPDPWWPWWSEP